MGSTLAAYASASLSSDLTVESGGRNSTECSSISATHQQRSAVENLGIDA